MNQLINLYMYGCCTYICKMERLENFESTMNGFERVQELINIFMYEFSIYIKKTTRKSVECGCEFGATTKTYLLECNQ